MHKLVFLFGSCGQTISRITYSNKFLLISFYWSSQKQWVEFDDRGLKSAQTRTFQHKIKCVLTFTKNDLTLVEIYAIALNFGSDMCQIKVGIVQVNTYVMWLENVRCPTIILCSAYVYALGKLKVCTSSSNYIVSTQVNFS